MADQTAGLPLQADRPPLSVDEQGVVRVGNTRITLDLVVEQYENGMTPEEIVGAYDTLATADVDAAIGDYLRQRDAVRTYLTRRRPGCESLRRHVLGDSDAG